MPDRFLIAPFNTGWQNDLKPFIIPDDAFPELINVFCYHGRIKKRFGETFMNTNVDESVQQLYSRLRIDLGTTDASTGNFSGTVPGTIFKVGQQFSIGTTIFTVKELGNPGTLLTTGSATGTYDTTTGALVITGNAENPLTSLYFYPGESVMGISNYESVNINNEPTYAFDTQFSYYFDLSNVAWECTDSATLWTGSNTDFFWSHNFRGANAFDRLFFVTNFVAADRIRYWNGSTWSTLSGASAQYDSNANNQIITARLIIGFKGRLLLLNTIESINNDLNDQKSYPFRLRYSQVGDPTQSTAGAEAWRENVGGKGGFIDATTREAIVSASIIKDRLIVYFESSTYELIYTGNQELPFRWQQINNELGVESTFSTITFDRSIIGIGNTGIHSCNGAYVERIDQKISDEVFNIKVSGNGVRRVYGIRDFFVQTVYWTFPSDITTDTFPTRVLVYNYENNTWALFEDSITAFGYYQPPTTGNFRAQFKHVIGGNQQGYTFITDPEITRNAPVLQISDISISGSTITLTVIDHNIAQSEVIAIENAQGISGLNDDLYEVAVIDSDTITVTVAGVTGTYTGGGNITRVSRIDFKTKQFNFYLSSGRNNAMTMIDFFVERSEEGSVTVDTLLNNGSSIGSSNTLSTAAESVLWPIEATQDSVWHSIFPFSDGNLIQLHIYLSDDQLLDFTDAWAKFELYAVLFHARSTSSRLQ